MNHITPHWNEEETVTLTHPVYGTITTTRFTNRAWTERYEYAVERVSEWVVLEEKRTPRPWGENRQETVLRKYADVVMVRLSDGYEEPLVTPRLFALKHGIRGCTGINILLASPHRKSASGWSIKGRTF